MVYDAVTLRARLLCQNGYVARPGWLTSVGWQSSGRGHLLVDTHSQDSGAKSPPTYCTVVGDIDPDRLYMGTIGNHNPAFSAPLQASKFQMTVKCPEKDAMLREDWNIGMKMLRSAQVAVAVTSDHRYFLNNEGSETTIRLSAPVFEKSVCLFLTLGSLSKC
ncbi:hypothetical protein NP233_g10313 [Leucocoprinus birnbaumii]|uniref:Uncharacterized protein n=1 Tax=Leucocoprinus birnbaumii TaxID=56174 RepID=A0AAD5YPZ3_9AGAR|nr:hypothetical protein NP233_g10313 [Leucocoprinus birnbaumii]